MIDLECPGCGASLSIPSGLAGATDVCPECGQTVVVPRSRRIQRVVRAALPLLRAHWKFYSLGTGVLVFALFLWPTPYYYRTEGGDLTRINRITQSVRYRKYDRWVSAPDLRDITFKPGNWSDGGLSYRLQNRTARPLGQITVAFYVRQGDQVERVAVVNDWCHPTVLPGLWYTGTLHPGDPRGGMEWWCELTRAWWADD